MGGSCGSFLWSSTHICHLSVWGSPLGISLVLGRTRKARQSCQGKEGPVIPPPPSLLILCEVVLDAGGSLPGSLDNRGCGDLPETRTTETPLAIHIGVAIGSSTGGPWFCLPLVARTPWGSTAKPMLSCPKSGLLSPRLQTEGSRSCTTWAQLAKPAFPPLPCREAQASLRGHTQESLSTRTHSSNYWGALAKTPAPPRPPPPSQVSAMGQHSHMAAGPDDALPQLHSRALRPSVLPLPPRSLP